MATRTPDTISARTAMKVVTSSVLVEIGGVLMFLDQYPQIGQASVAVFIMQKGGGTGTLVIWDYFGAVELGRLDFTNDSYEGKVIQLNGLPTPNENGVAYIEFQIKNVGGLSARLAKAMVEYS